MGIHGIGSRETPQQRAAGPSTHEGDKTNLKLTQLHKVMTKVVKDEQKHNSLNNAQRSALLLSWLHTIEGFVTHNRGLWSNRQKVPWSAATSVLGRCSSCELGAAASH